MPAPFQFCVTLGLIFALVGKYPLVSGLSFLEKMPNQFECLEKTATTMNKEEASHQQRWIKCNKEEICAEKMAKDKYRPVKSDPEYFDNWVGKFDLLCKRKEEIGFIGSSFFIGIIASILIIPRIADKYGWAQQIKMAIVLQIMT